MATALQAFCLDEAAQFLYVLDAGSTFQIWQINAVTKQLVKTIDLSSITTPVSTLVIQAHNGTIWLMSQGFDTRVPNYIYKINATSGAITTLDKSADFQSVDVCFIQSGGTLYIPGIQYNLIYYTHGSNAASFDPTGLIFTDTNVDFIAAGVQANDFFTVFGTDSFNPGAPIQTVSTNQLTFQFAPDSPGPYTFPYNIMRPFGDGNQWQPILGEYDATTGAGSALLLPPPPTSRYSLSWYMSANRQTGEIFILPNARISGSNTLGIVQCAGATYTESTSTFDTGSVFTNARGLASSDNGHIHIATSTVSGNAGKIVTYQNISDPAPTTSNPWPGPGGGAERVGLDTYFDDLYMCDATSGLYVMHGDGPAIALADPAVLPVVASSDSGNNSIIGDETNGGIWLLYNENVKFWDPVAGHVTFAIGPPVAAITADSHVAADLHNPIAADIVGAGSTFSASMYVVNRVPQAAEEKRRLPKDPFVPRTHYEIKPPRRKGP